MITTTMVPTEWCRDVPLLRTAAAREAEAEGGLVSRWWTEPSGQEGKARLVVEVTVPDSGRGTRTA